MINNLKRTNLHHANCESSERVYLVKLLGFVDSESSDIKNSQSDRLTGSVRLCSNDDRFNCVQDKFKQKRYTFKCIAVFYEGMERGYRSKPFVIDFDTRTLKKRAVSLDWAESNIFSDLKVSLCYDQPTYQSTYPLC